MIEPPPPPPAPPSPPEPPAAPRNRPSRRQLGIALVAIVAVLAGAVTAVVLVGRRSGPSATHAHSGPSTRQQRQSQPTVPEEIMLRYANRDGQLDLEGALELFSYAFAPLPGVTLPSGLPDQPAHWTDVALDSILTHYAELTANQRQVVLSFLNLGSAAATSSSQSAPTTAAQAELTGYRLVDAVQQQFQVKVQQALQDEAARLGHTLADVGVTNPNVQVQAVLANVELTANKGLQAGAWTWATSGPVTIDPNSADPPGALTGKPTACYIYFPPSFWKNLTWVPGSFEYATLYHEVFHCYQFFVLGQNDLAIPYAAPDWLIEGSATWAGDSMSGYDDPTWATVLQDNTPYGYLNNPRTALDSKAHDAFGLFYEVEYLGRPLWSEWWGIFSSAAEGDWGTTEWFDAVAGDRLTDLTNAWGSSYFENGDLGHDWAETAAHQTTTYQSVASLFSGSLGVMADPYSTYQVTIPEQSSGDLVVILTSHGTPRYVDEDGKGGIGDDEVALCWGSCDTSKCPGGTSSQLPEVTDVTGTVDWALTALDDGGIAQMVAVDTADFCKKKQNWNPNSNQPPPCAWTCAGSNGDPHVTTVDYHGYAFQAAGEYVLLRSPDGSVEIQERQEPWSQQTKSIASDNTAVVARVGSHRVGVYSNGGAQNFVVEIDGAPVTLTAPMTLSGGGRVAPATNEGLPRGIEVDFPDGTMLWALYTEGGQKFGINLEIAPSAALHKDAVGILGLVSNGDRLPALPNATGLPATTAAAAAYKYEYQTFAPAWRVTPSDSLFDYAPGKTTASYNYPGFVPEGGPPPILIDAPTMAASNTTCAAIVDVELRDDCVYDVTATGDAGFAAQYAQTDSFVVKGAAPPGAAPPSGTLLHALLPNVSNLAGTAVGTDGTLYILVFQSSENKSSIIAVDPTTTTILRQAVVSANPVPNGLAFSSGSLFLITAAGQQCAVAQVDPTTLSVVATVPMPQCPTLIGGATTATPSGLAVAAATSAVWVCDGPNLLQVNIANKTLGPAIPTGTTIFGSLIASATTVFWVNEVGIYQVGSGAASLNQIDGGVDAGEVVLPDGDGLWEQGGGGTAFFVDNFSTGPSTTLDIGGTPVGADANDIYSEDPTTHDVEQHSIQGGQSAEMGKSTLESDGPPLLIGPRNAYRVFTSAPGPGQPLTLYVENIPLP